MKSLILTLAAGLSVLGHADNSGFSLNYRYENAATSQIERGTSDVQLPASGLNMFYQVPEMRKSVAVVKLADGIRLSLDAWQATCNDTKDQPQEPTEPLEPIEPNDPNLPFPVITLPSPFPIIPDEPQPTETAEFTDECRAQKDNVANNLENLIKAFEAEIPHLEAVRRERLQRENPSLTPSQLQIEAVDPKLRQAVELNLKLVKLMREAKPEPIWAFAEFAMAVAFDGPMAITTGGAQDARKYRDLIESEQIPLPNDYYAYGYINEFDLSLYSTCPSLLCVAPVVAYDSTAGKLYVQADMSTNVQISNFSRRAVNVGILIDISGSMGATDETDRNRLEWAKEAVQATLNNMVEGQDYITISTFTDDAQQIWPRPGQQARALTASDRQEILELIRQLETQGSTNLNAGLQLGYDLLAQTKMNLGAAAQNFEHRLITITDANLNVDPDESGAVVLAERMAESRGINLTVIGVGLNFFQEFVNKLTLVRGGNYIFAQNGQDMLEYFTEFDTLVTPVAYNFVADFNIDSSKYRFVRAHGVPEDAAVTPVDNVIDIKTLFFARPKTSGGGARVLEFDVL